uniref:Uncharacterized protein n=1 Tax=viral metagenome TaxID=1070528 RepID=A0A6C0C6C0_9ZZZZ
MDSVTKQHIVEKINDRYYKDIELGLMGRSGWKTTGDISETLGYIFLGVSTMISFSAGFFDIRMLSFVAGCVGIFSSLLFKFALYSMAQSKERTDEVNKILMKIGIEKVVDISPDQLFDATHKTAPVRNKETELAPNEETIIII